MPTSMRGAAVEQEKLTVPGGRGIHPEYATLWSAFAIHNQIQPLT
ncbi:MAG: hypothetical protein ABI222_04350 [Opitutaceae bacterium]